MNVEVKPMLNRLILFLHILTRFKILHAMTNINTLRVQLHSKVK